MHESWREALRSAPTENAVLEVIRRYVASWSRDDVALLPAGYWPDSIDDGNELVVITFKVGELHTEFDGDHRTHALIQDLLLFLTQACVRMVQLSGQRDTPGCDAGANQGTRIGA